jgi:glycosyltransferase involved in cell wall biosynthesis
VRILFVHDNFPAQFGAFGAWLARRGWEVTFATAREDAEPPARTRLFRYRPHREPTRETHPYARPLEKAAIAAQAFARAALPLREKGYRPDIVMAHSGWGAGMFAKDIFPEAVSVPYVEWWYNHPAPDAAFLARGGGRAEDTVETPLLQRARNAPILMDLSGADAALCPTRFQAAQFPPWLGQRLTVTHDGVDTTTHAPRRDARADTLDGLLPEGAEVVTYATRGMEPQRGFPQFIRALPRIFAARPNAHAVIAGENRVAYGGARDRAVDWKAKLLAEVAPDPARVHFVGRLSRPAYVRLLQRSDAHVYLTAPFVLSWSMMEAMATGCLLVASDTEPVREMATHGETALLTDFFDEAALADRIAEALAEPGRFASMRAAARAFIVDGFDAETLNERRAGWLRGLR